MSLTVFCVGNGTLPMNRRLLWTWGDRLWGGHWGVGSWGQMWDLFLGLESGAALSLNPVLSLTGSSWPNCWDAVILVTVGPNDFVQGF